ncbi:MAG: spore photoproduct lyase family protein [Phycisphaerae bacterium]
MYALKPSHVFVHRRLRSNPLAVARMDRMLAALGNPPVTEIDASDTAAVLALAGPAPGTPRVAGRVRQGVERRPQDPSLIFNTFVWDESQRQKTHPCAAAADVQSQRIARLLAGVGEEFAFSHRERLVVDGRQYVCQGGWGIHSLKGCPHKCDYCEEGYYLNIMCDVEEFVEHVYQMTLRRPQQKLYRYDLFSDQIALEPEYGASAALAEMFARTGDKFLLYYTKSDNVEHLLDLPKSNAIFYCTLATQTVCREIERGTPSMSERIEALRRCQQAGYRVRVGFSPIIPVPDWKREATECLEKLFAVVRPETVRLWVLSLMSPSECELLIGPKRLDRRFLEAMRSPAAMAESAWSQPFPRQARAEIYAHYLDEIRRISPGTPVTLCSEEPQVWEMLAGKLQMRPEDLYCCCGGTSA